MFIIYIYICIMHCGRLYVHMGIVAKTHATKIYYIIILGKICDWNPISLFQLESYFFILAGQTLEHVCEEPNVCTAYNQGRIVKQKIISKITFIREAQSYRRCQYRPAVIDLGIARICDGAFHLKRLTMRSCCL